MTGILDNQTHATSNDSLCNTTEGRLDGTVTTGGWHIDVMNTFVLTSSIGSPMFHLVTLVVLLRCRLISFQLKYISISFIISECLGGLSVFIHTILIGKFNVMSPLILNTRLLMGISFVLVSWSSIACLSVDRVLIINFALRYSALATKPRVALVILMIWIFNFSVILMTSLIGNESACTIASPWACGCTRYQATTRARTTGLVLVLFYLAVVLVCCFELLRIVNAHRRQIALSTGIATAQSQTPNPQRMELRSTKAVLHLLAANVVLYAPYIICFELIVAQSDQPWRKALQFLGYVCIQINFIACMGIFIWKMDECRLQFMLVFLSWSQRYREKAEVLRMSVYNIVVAFERDS